MQMISCSYDDEISDLALRTLPWLTGGEEAKVERNEWKVKKEINTALMTRLQTFANQMDREKRDLIRGLGD